MRNDAFEADAPKVLALSCSAVETFGPGKQHRRQHAGEDSCKKGNSNSIGQHRCIDMNCVGAGQIEPIRGQPADSRASENDAQHATREADEHTLSNLLADEAHAAASQRRAHCHLFAARDGPGNQQIRQVQAGDEQKTEDGDHQNIKRGFGAAYDIVDERKRNDCGCQAVTAEAGKDSVLDRAYFLGGAAQGNAGLRRAITWLVWL